MSKKPSSPAKKQTAQGNRNIQVAGSNNTITVIHPPEPGENKGSFLKNYSRQISVMVVMVIVVVVLIMVGIFVVLEKSQEHQEQQAIQATDSAWTTQVFFATATQKIIASKTQSAQETKIARETATQHAALSVTQAATVTATTTSTFTPIPTITRTFTPFLTPTNTPLAAVDYAGLENNCIPARYWAMNSDTPTTGGCLSVEPWGLFGDYRAIRIIQPSEKVHNGNITATIFLPLKKDFNKDVDISFDINIGKISNNGKDSPSPLFSVGICNQVRINNSFHFISFSYGSDGITEGVLKNNTDFWVGKTYPYKLESTISYLIQVRTYKLIFTQTTDNIEVLNETVTPDEHTAFCIQYRMPIDGTLDASIENILIEQK